MGVSLYELVTGKRPFDGDSQFAIMSAHLQGTPVPPVTIDPRLPQLLNDVILMSVAKDANARFQTAGAVRNALSNVVAEREAAPPPVRRPAPLPPAAAAPVGQPAKAAQPVSHRGQWMVLGAVAAVLAIVAVVAIAPWKGTGAAPAKVAAPVAAQPAAAQPPAAQPLPPQPPPAVTAQPEPQPQQPAAPAPCPASAASPSRASRSRGRRQGGARGIAVRGACASRRAACRRPLRSRRAAAAPQQAAPQQPAAPAGPSRAELQQVRESIALVGVRAAGIRTSLQSLQRSQAASGLNLRGDMQAAANLMNYLPGWRRCRAQRRRCRAGQELPGEGRAAGAKAGEVPESLKLK